MNTIRRVAVLGAGTMGSRIAAHLANAGIPALLLDVVLPDVPERSAASRRGLDAAAKGKPSAFFTSSGRKLVETGNFEDDMARVESCDWIIEAVTENLDIKRALWDRVAAARSPGSILSTNTSGIPLRFISEGWPEEMRRNFLGTHFFNPPRYLHLVEIIPGADTAQEVLGLISDLCDRRLGKGVVLCKDTPNFIGNRIGSFWGATVNKITIEDEYTVEEVDALTGSLIGLPNSASFRLLDIVGLDIWIHVSENLYPAVPHDPWRDRLLPAPFQKEMMRRGWLGEKTGQGFYRRVGKEREIWALDWKTLEYHPAAKASFPSAETARGIEDLPSRLRMLISQDDRAGRFLWKLYSDVLVYSASVAPEISDRVVEIDRAMRWGYAQTLGPFELWDALGFQNVARRMEKEGRALPENVRQMLSAGAESFYRPDDRDGAPRTLFFDLPSATWRELDERPGVLVLKDTKRARGVVQSNPGASLVDLGDGVLNLEFHSKMNTLGEDQIRMIYTGLDETQRNFQAMVIGNQGENFSAGANLMMVLLMAQDGEWEDLDAAVRRFQQANLAIKYAARPVVAAPQARALGGGCEVVLHAARVQASAELYMGLVEVGVGVIPAAGGCKELLMKLKDPQRVFELIGYAKVSSSAAEAKELGLLGRNAEVSMNQERLIADAKALALAAVPGFVPRTASAEIEAGGDAVYALLRMGAWLARQGEYISEHDLFIAEKLAGILSGGRLTGRQTVSEQHLLDLEREAFLSLCGTAKTQARIAHMLKTGKPLRN